MKEDATAPANQSSAYARILASVNLFVLSSLFLIHLGFAADTGPMPSAVFYLIVGRFLILIVELMWLSRRVITQLQMLGYAWGSIAFNLAFGFLLSYVANLHDSHYHVLMLIPIVAAALYLPLTGLVCVVLAAMGFTFLNLFIYYRRHPPTDLGEYFEGTTTALIYVVAGAVVWLLVRKLDEKQRQLADHLQQLQATRSRLLEEEKLAAVGRLSSAIAHEIRNPVAVIASALESASQPGTGNGQRDEILALASREALRLTRLTEEFLSYARTRPPERSRFALSALLDYAISLARPHAQKRRVGLVLAALPMDPLINVDQFQFQQVMQNLILNAIDASPEDTQVSIAVEFCNDQLSIQVSNAGERISPDLEGQIFEPFFTTKHQGTGLGLAIARKIATAHGGALRLVRNDTDQICFEFTVPIEHDATSQDAILEKQDGPGSGGG